MVAVATAVRETRNTSPAVHVVSVKSLVVVLRTWVPVEIAMPLVLMTSDMVGIAVPVATFQNFTVPVPASTLIVQAETVQEVGIENGIEVVTAVSAEPPL
jgi:hypothetical protein